MAQDPPNRTRWRTRLAVLLGTLVVLLLLFEAGARIYARTQNKQRGMDYDPVLGYRMRPDVVKVGSQWSADEPAWTNSQGWRDEEMPRERNPDKRRVVVLGDSFTFGMGVDYGQRFSEYLELHPQLEVYNMGINGYGPDQACLLLEEEALDYDPDLVVLVTYISNDVDDVRYSRNGHWPKPHFLLEDGELVLVPPERTWDVNLRLSSYLGEGLFDTWRLRLPDRVRAAAWKEADTVPLLVAIGARMQSRCQEAGVPFLVLFGHHPHRVSEGPWENERRALEGFRELGIPTIDSLPAIRAASEAGQELFLPNIHWNAAGHRLIADLLWDEIRVLLELEADE